MQPSRFYLVQCVRAAPRIEPRVPKRFTRIDIANSRDVGLVEQELFQRTPGSCEQFAEPGDSKPARKRIDPKAHKAGARIGRFPGMDAAEMAPIRKAQDSFVQFERNV